MTVIDDLFAANARHAAAAADSDLGAPPARRVAVVTCMDARIDVAAVLGLAEGDAHVVRNAGGIVTDDVVRSLVLSQRALGTTHILVMQHTRCGVHGLDDDELAAAIEEETGVRPPFAFGGFSEIEERVRRSVTQLRTSPFLPHTDQIRGSVYDVTTRLVREIEVPQA